MKKQLLLLCLCNATTFAGFSALIGLMPVYLPQLGADSTVTGFFLAITYSSLAIGTVLGGWLSDRFQRRKHLIILSGMLAVPLSWLMSQTTSVGVLLLLMACLWFVTGITMTMINILMGLFSEAVRKGRNFGLLYLSAGFGMFLGGIVNGRIVDSGGFTTLFKLFALFYLLIPLVGQFIEDKSVHTERKSAPSLLRIAFTNRTFTLLFIAIILAQASNIVMFLTRPLLMDRLNFDATAIGSTSGIGSLVTLPLPLLIGWLADRINRKVLLFACFLAPALGLLTLVVATDLWQFWVSSVLSTILGVNTVVGSSLMIELFAEDVLSAPLALLNATPWIGIVLGLSAGGVAISAFQIIPTLILALLPNLLAIFLLIRTPTDQPKYQAETG